MVRGRALAPAIVFLCAATAFMVHAQLVGQDVNWDRQNYHAYDAFALLHWRYGNDVAPGGPQSFINPVPYLPDYVFRRVFGAHVGDLLEAALQAIVAPVLFVLLRQMSSRRSIVAPAFGSMAGLGAAMSLAEIGTSFDELLLSVLPLSGLSLLASGVRSSRRIVLLAGVLTGATAGFKLPMLYTAIALVAATPALTPAGARLRCANLVCIGLIAGFLLTGGVWAAHLAWSYGNPVFPFLNAVFRSRSAAPVNFADPRFHFMGLGHALAVPWLTATGAAPTAETSFRDPRPLVAALVALAVTILAAGRQRLVLFGGAAWLLSGMAAWLVLAPIERYAVPLDMLGGGFAVVAVVEAASAFGSARIAAFASAVVTLLLIGWTRQADFFHRTWADRYVARPPTIVTSDSTEILLGVPLGYWPAASPHPAVALDVYPSLLVAGGRLRARFVRAIAAAGDRLVVAGLDINVDPEVRETLAGLGVAIAPPCERAPSMVWVPTVFCRGVPVASGPSVSALHVGQPVAFNASGVGWIFEAEGWDATEPDGTWAKGKHQVLAFALKGGTPAGLAAELVLSAVPGTGARQVRIDAAGRPTVTVVSSGSGERVVSACVGAERSPGAVVRIRFSTDDVRSMAELGAGAETRPLAFRLHRLTVRADPGCGNG